MQRHRDRLEQSPSSLARVRVSRFCSDFVSCFLLFRFLFPLLLLLLFACHFTCHLCGLSPSYSPFHMSSLWSFPFLHSISYVISVVFPLPTLHFICHLCGLSPPYSPRASCSRRLQSQCVMAWAYCSLLPRSVPPCTYSCLRRGVSCHELLLNKIKKA